VQTPEFALTTLLFTFIEMVSFV